MSRLLGVCTLVLFGVTLLAASHSLAAVGSTPVSADVTQTGQAAVSIPIVAPGATRNLAPSLSLEYQSSGGNSWLGVGWTLSGLSSIERCRDIPDRAGGQYTGVELVRTDRYCLDGSHLVHVGGGAYGFAGSQYRTEAETYSRVTAFGSAGEGPQYFRVERKDGLFVEYGSQADSRVEAAGGALPTVRTWLVERIADRDGNAIDFAYEKTDGGYRPTEIQYGGNPTVGTAHTHRVTLEWENRATEDTPVAYIAGFLVREPKRLRSITVAYGATQLRKYNLAYQSSPTGGRSRLDTIQECVDTDCLPTTNLAWQSGVSGWPASASSGVNSPYGSGQADLNGDGRTDYIYVGNVAVGTTGQYCYRPGTSAGLAPEVCSTAPSNVNVLLISYVGKFRDSPRQQLLTSASPFIQDGNLVLVELNPTSNQISETIVANPFQGNGQPTGTYDVADVNGDTLSDLVYFNNVVVPGVGTTSTLYARMSNGAGAFGAAQVLWSAANEYLYPFHKRLSKDFGDVNDDGRTDFAFEVMRRTVGGPSEGYRRLLVSSGATGYVDGGSVAWASNTGPLPYLVGDFNGDGLQDYLTYTLGEIVYGRGRQIDGSFFTAPIAPASRLLKARSMRWSMKTRTG